MNDKAVFVAGGTGGHINGAIALGEKFSELKFRVKYISGRRHLDFKLYEKKDCQHVLSYPLVGKNPFFILKSLVFNGLVLFLLFFRFLIDRPRFVFGAGGYVCGPALLAAYLLGIPVFILEQNSVMGLTNKMLSKLARTIFTSFKATRGLCSRKNVKNYGNPLRKEFFSMSLQKERDDGFHLLAFGGSLGAREINDLMADLLACYRPKRKISIVHQTGKNAVEEKARAPLISYEKMEYLDDIATQYAKADLIICRAGASTISELRVAQRPVIIAPITTHKDLHQVHNANALKEEAAFCVYIADVAQLRANCCEKLQNLIEVEYNKKAKGTTHDATAPLKDAAALIAKAVLDNV